MKEMGRIFWCHSVGVLAISLAMIFVPIFLLKTGFSFTEVLLYLLLQQVFSVLLQYPASRCFQFVSAHHLLVAGAVCYIVFFGLLSTLETYDWPLALLAIVWALNRTIYWTAFHYIFGLARRPIQAGRQVAGINALVIFATTIAPAVGGVIATLFGIGYIYIAAICLLLLSIIPMLRQEKTITKTRLSLSRGEIWAIRRDALANMSNGVIVIGEFSLWPLLVFIVVSSYAGVGLLSSVIALASIIVTLYVGRREEKRGERRYIKQGLVVYSLTNFGRIIVQNGFQIFGLNLLSGIGRSLYLTPFMNRYYINSDGTFRLGYITIMEGAFSLGASIFVGLLLLISVLLPMSSVLAIGLGLVALGVAGVRLMR